MSNPETKKSFGNKKEASPEDVYRDSFRFEEFRNSTLYPDTALGRIKSYLGWLMSVPEKADERFRLSLQRHKWYF